MDQAWSHQRQNDAAPSDMATELQDLYAKLNQQRLIALRAYWLTLAKVWCTLPLSFLPLASMFLLMASPPFLADYQEIQQRLRDTIQPNASAWFLGCLGWLFVSAYLLIRYFKKHGKQPRWDYVRDYKTQLYTHLCEVHFPGLRYNSKKYIGYDEFDATELFPYTADEYLSEDFFEGHIGSTDVHFCEAHAKRERKTWDNGRRRTYYETYFQGMVFVADFHKHFHSTSRLIPRGQKLVKIKAEQPVTFADPDFESLFTTASTDQTDVRYVLSASMLQRFVTLAKRFPGMRARFHQEQLILLLPTNRDQFEPSLYRRPDSRVQIESFVSDIQLVWPIVETLDLDTRIWSKR